MTFLRLRRWDWIAFAAGLALILVMSLPWWSDKQGEECARVEQLQTPTPGVQGAEITRDVKRDAQSCKAKHRKTAWQADGLIDRLIMVLLVAAAFFVVLGAFLRAADRRLDQASPFAFATVIGLAAGLLVLYRILQPPGFNPGAVVKAGAPIGLAVVGVLTFAARWAVLSEREALAAGPAQPTAAGEGAPEAPAQQAPPPEPEPPLT